MSFERLFLIRICWELLLSLKYLYCRAVREESVDLCAILLRMLDLGSQKIGLAGVTIEAFFPLLLSYSHQVGFSHFKIVENYLFFTY